MCYKRFELLNTGKRDLPALLLKLGISDLLSKSFDFEAKLRAASKTF